MRRLAEAMDLARASRSRIAKEQSIAGALASIDEASDPDGIALATAARLMVGRTLAVGDGRSLGAGGSLLFDIAVSRSGFKSEIVGACARTVGDLGETLGLLAARDPAAEARPGISLADIAALFETLASTGNRLAKYRALDETFARATPLETKYLAKAVLGSLRVGAQAGVLEGALARAFDAPIEKVRRATALVTDVGQVAILARQRRLDDAHMEVGRPVAFMLAAPLETIASDIDPELFVMEDKIDGVRAQLHKRGADVSIFARGLDRMTAAFPEIVDAFAFVPGGVALDGEIVAVLPDGRPRPFQALQARLRRLRPTPAMMAETPVAFVAYDVLSDGERDLLALPWKERRTLLEVFAHDRGPRDAFVLHPFAELPRREPPGAATPAEILSLIDAPFEAARARGFEGLVLKRTDAPYEAGRRGLAWIKVKRAYATLDVVVTGAEEGHGRRAGVLSDYTFGVWSGDVLVNVGKAYSGLTDPEIEALSRDLEHLAVGREHGLRRIPPAVVLEVAFDGVQPSTRHESGFALRFPRIVRIRADKRPEEADRIEAVRALWQAQVETGHREESTQPRVTFTPRGRKRSKTTNQLDLFPQVVPPKRES